VGGVPYEDSAVEAEEGADAQENRATEFSTYKTVKARFWPWLSDESLKIL